MFMHTKRKEKWSGLETCVAVFKVKLAVILRQDVWRQVSEPLRDLCICFPSIMNKFLKLHFVFGSVLSVKLHNMLQNHYEKKMLMVRIFNIYMKLSFECVSFLIPPKRFGLEPFEIVV